MCFCFKQERNNNNEANSGQQPHDGGVQPDDGGVQPDHDGIMAIKSEVWITIINIYLQMVYL
jgi:hypothetical protein